MRATRNFLGLSLALTSVLFFAPSLPPYHAEPVEMEAIDKVALEGPLATNAILDSADRMTTEIRGESNYGRFKVTQKRA